MIDNNNQPNTMENFFGTAALYLAPKGWFHQNKIAIAQLEQEWNLPLVDANNRLISPKIVEHAGAALASSLRPTFFNFFAHCCCPGLAISQKKNAYAQNAVNLARVAIALERWRLAHGEFPESPRRARTTVSGKSSTRYHQRRVAALSPHGRRTIRSLLRRLE